MVSEMDLVCEFCSGRINPGEDIVKVEVGKRAGLWMLAFNLISYYSRGGRGVSVAHIECINDIDHDHNEPAKTSIELNKRLRTV